MFWISTNGGNKHMRWLAEDTIVYLMKKELPRRRVLHLDIEIKSLRKERVLGMIDSWREEGKNFSIMELDNSSQATVYDFVETICHEFVHMKQFLTGDYRQKGNKIYWKGHDCSDMSYYRQPWEKQAFAEQGPLAKYIIKEKLHMTIKKAKEMGIREYR